MIQDYKDKKISRIDINEFAAIYEEESHRKTASFKELVEGLKCIDPMNGENGKKKKFLNAVALHNNLKILELGKFSKPLLFRTHPQFFS